MLKVRVRGLLHGIIKFQLKHPHLVVVEGHGSRLAAMALSAVISTIVLILVGSIVRVTGNGLGCLHWPLCYGQPIPPLFRRGAWVEFSHRLVALGASSQIVLVLVLAWRHYRRDKWVFRPALLANLLLFGAVCAGRHSCDSRDPAGHRMDSYWERDVDRWSKRGGIGGRAPWK